MTEPKPKPRRPAAPSKEDGLTPQQEAPAAAETGMISEGDGAGARTPAEGERPGGMIGEG